MYVSTYKAQIVEGRGISTRTDGHRISTAASRSLNRKESKQQKVSYHYSLRDHTGQLLLLVFPLLSWSSSDALRCESGVWLQSNYSAETATSFSGGTSVRSSGASSLRSSAILAIHVHRWQETTITFRTIRRKHRYRYFFCASSQVCGRESSC